MNKLRHQILRWLGLYSLQYTLEDLTRARCQTRVGLDTLSIRIEDVKRDSLKSVEVFWCEISALQSRCNDLERQLEEIQAKAKAPAPKEDQPKEPPKRPRSWSGVRKAIGDV